MTFEELKPRIEALGDGRAKRVLAALPCARHATGDEITSLSPGILVALREALPPAPGKTTPASEGELARAALLLLAQQGREHGGLEALVTGPTPRSFALIETAAVLTAVLLVLQTDIEFRYAEGKCICVLRKKPTDTKLLKGLVAKLLAFGSK